MKYRRKSDGLVLHVRDDEIIMGMNPIPYHKLIKDWEPVEEKMTYIVSASDTMISFKNELSAWEKLCAHLKHRWKCTTYFHNLVRKHQGKKMSIYADRICYICGKSENMLIYQRKNYESESV